jgi:Tfp pilus assembly protein PilN
MSHIINLLDPNEVHYLSAAESNPLYKIGAAGAVAVLLGLVTLYYFSLQETITTAEQLKARWAEIEQQVIDAEDMNNRKIRVEQGLQTLQGWEASRVNWDRMMTYLTDQVPGSLENIQFTRLQVSETMEGLRNTVPGSEAADIYPLERLITLRLRGIIRSTRPERLLTQFQRNLTNGPAPADFEEVALERYTQLRNEAGEITDLTTFAFTLRFTPRELVP